MRRKGLPILLAVAALLLVASPNAAAQVPPPAPDITEAPMISGTARVGETLMASPGQWTPQGEGTATYQWRRCSGSPVQSCEDIAGETNPLEYRVRGQDAGATIHIRLTVTLNAQSDTIDSTATVPVSERPSNTEPPAITGVPREGRLLTASLGTWRGTPPPSLIHLWWQCDGDDCTPVHAGGDYRLSDADVGRTIQLSVTALNEAGSVTVRSARTDRVLRAPLVNIGAPTIAGTAAVDMSLAASPGQWRSSGPIEFRYQWLRCQNDGSRCDPIPDADSAAYQVGLGDIGFRLRVRVTARGEAGAGSDTHDSALTGLVPAPAGVLPFTQSGGSVLPRTTALKLMRPFPRVRIKGYYTNSGAVVQLLTIKWATRARIAIGCRGTDCPYRRRVHRGRQRVRVRSLEKSYRAGTRVTIRITKPALIGKYVRIVIRANGAPKRRDRCLMPDSTHPTRCSTPDSAG